MNKEELVAARENKYSEEMETAEPALVVAGGALLTSG
jgi:hypothetical protein